MRAHFNKRCVLALSVYTAGVIYLIYFIQLNIYPEPVRCHALSPTELQSENSFQNIVDSHLTKQFPQKYIYENYSDMHSSWTKFSENVYVFSAYVDDCESALSTSNSKFCVKFIGMSLLSESINMRCAFKTFNNFTAKLGSVQVDIVEEHHDKHFAATYFYCSLAGTDRSFASEIKYASLYMNGEDILWHPVYPISSNFNQTVETISLSLCVRPFYGFYSSVQLIEFVTYYSVIGVDHFIFYKDKTSEAMYPFFAYLSNMSSNIEILPWDIPLNNELIHEYGQIIFTQECISHSKYDFTHTLIVDVDEYIVPKKHENIKLLLKYLDNEYKDASNYVIPSTFFCNEYIIEKTLYPLHILSHNRRQKTPWQHWYRSKYILKPKKVLHGGIHFVWKSVKGSYEVCLPDSLVLVHHYRNCCGVQQTWFRHLFNFYVLSDEVVIDNSLRNHGHKILKHSLIDFIYTLKSCNASDID